MPKNQKLKKKTIKGWAGVINGKIDKNLGKDRIPAYAIYTSKKAAERSYYEEHIK